MPIDDLDRHLLLRACPESGMAALAARMERVQLSAGQLLYDSGERITHVYFPITAVVSFMVLMENGATMEIASTGSEGVVGLPATMGCDTMPSRAEVRCGGLALRIRTFDLKRELEQIPLLKKAFLLYAQMLLTQISQLSACNRHHSVSQQLCRWLLLALGRSGSSHIAITQQAVANMLGVRREGVTEASGKLQQAGIINHVRGRVTVLDRARLAAAACECHGIMQHSLDELRTRLAELGEDEPAGFASSALLRGGGSYTASGGLHPTTRLGANGLGPHLRGES
ncbi:Crp/Fnr family transcriptional regulator [Chitinasiproducens palmae]|nr:Crp/Fnr family transcriptional regulator [Chitinasiproducens palmae]